MITNNTQTNKQTKTKSVTTSNNNNNNNNNNKIKLIIIIIIMAINSFTGLNPENKPKHYCPLPPIFSRRCSGCAT